MAWRSVHDAAVQRLQRDVSRLMADVYGSGSSLKSCLKRDEEKGVTVQERDQLLAIIKQQSDEIERLTKKKKKKVQVEESCRETLKSEKDTVAVQVTNPNARKVAQTENSLATRDLQMHQSAEKDQPFIKPKKRDAANMR